MEIQRFNLYFMILLLISASNTLFSSSLNHLGGYLIIQNIDEDYRIIIYDLNKQEKFPVQCTRYKDYLIPYANNFFNFDSYMKINNENFTLSSVDMVYEQQIKTRGVKSEVYIYSLNEFKFLKKYILNNYSIKDYQVISDDEIFVLTHNYYKTPWGIEIWNPKINKIKILYETTNYLQSFHYFKNFNMIVFEEKHALYKLSISENKKIYITNAFDANYSEQFNKVIFNNEISKKIEYYDILQNKTFTTELNSCLRAANFCFITPDIMCCAQQYTPFNILSLIGMNTWCYYHYTLYDINTKETKIILNGITDVITRRIQFSDKDLSFLK